MKKYGPSAVVTGGARGLGKSLALEFASQGLHVILIDILEKELAETTNEIEKQYGVQAKAIHADLSDLRQIPRIINECAAYEVGLFCCNHAASHLFPDGKLRLWLETSIEDLRAMMTINLSSSLELLYHFTQEMSTRKHGGIVLVSSGGALTGAPYLAQYSATKAFLLNLGESLWWELKRDGIDVLTVLPGLTKTPGMLKFINSVGKEKMPMMPSEEVARHAISSLGKKIHLVPGGRNRLQAFLTAKLLPRKLSVSSMGKLLPQFFNTK